MIVTILHYYSSIITIKSHYLVENKRYALYLFLPYWKKMECKRLRDATIVLQTRVFSFVIKKR